MEGLTLQQLQSMGAKPIAPAPQKPQTGGITLEQLKSMGAKPVSPQPIVPATGSAEDYSTTKMVAQELARPFLKAASSIGSAGRGISSVAEELAGNKEKSEELWRQSQEIAKGVDYGYFGKVGALGQKDSGVKNLLEAIGVGAEIGSYVPAGGIAKGAVTGLRAIRPASQAIKGAAIQAAKTGIKEGPVFGALQGAGSAIQGEKVTPGGVLGSTVLGALGGVLAAPLGAGLSVIARPGLATKAIMEGIGITPGKLEPFLDYMYSKAVRPSVAGKKTDRLYKKALQDARTAIGTIIYNKPNLTFVDDAGNLVTGKLPSNINEFSQATNQTKKWVFNEYDRLARESGQTGAKIELTPIVSSLDEVANNKVLNDIAPNVANYARSQAERFRARGSYTAQEAQDVLEALNKELTAYYRNPNPSEAHVAVVKAKLASDLRASLDNFIEGTTGGQYQEIKRLYGALRGIENDVEHRMIVNARKAKYTLPDQIVGAASIGTMLHGLLSLSPASIASSVAMQGLKMFQKAMNDPDRIIRVMFEGAEKKGAMKEISELFARQGVSMEKLAAERESRLRLPPGGKPQAIQGQPMVLPKKSATDVEAAERAAREAGAIKRPEAGEITPPILPRQPKAPTTPEYEPYMPPEKLPVIQMGPKLKPESKIPVIQVEKMKPPKTGGKATAGTIAAGAGVASIPFLSRLIKPARIELKNEAVPIEEKTNISNIREAIKVQETGGEKNPYSTRRFSGKKKLGYALGAYQITEGELKTYGKKYLGQEITPEEFLKSKELQDAYMEEKLRDFRENKKYSDEQMVRYHRGGQNTGDNTYPEYVNAVLQLLNKAKEPGTATEAKNK